MIRLVLIIALSFAAANCGQKGPLEPPTSMAVDTVPHVFDSLT